MQKVRPMEGKARGSNSWAEAVARSCSDADRAPQGTGSSRERLKITGQGLERTQVQADWVDPSDPPTHTATPSTRQEDHQHNQSARSWAASGAASGLCISTMDRGSRSQASAWSFRIAPPLLSPHCSPADITNRLQSPFPESQGLLLCQQPFQSIRQPKV